MFSSLFNAESSSSTPFTSGPPTNMSQSARILLFQWIIITFSIHLLRSSSAQTQTQTQTQKNPSCSSSYCGDIQITHPFRLQSDPETCGFPDPIFAVECRANRTVLRSGSRDFYVQSITYSNYTIRLVDPGLVNPNNFSSCPIYTFRDNDDVVSSQYITFANNAYISFLSCRTPQPENPLYIENPICKSPNSSYPHSYFVVGWVSSWDLKGDCMKDNWMMGMAPWNLQASNRNFTYLQVHDLLAHGFEISWYRTMCGECERKGEDWDCDLEDNKIRCKETCHEDTALNQRSFRCKLDFYAPWILFVGGITIGSILVLRFLCGVGFLIGVAVYKRRKERGSIGKKESVISGSRDVV